MSKYKVGDDVVTDDGCRYTITDLPGHNEHMPNHYRGRDESDGMFGLFRENQIEKYIPSMNTPLKQNLMKGFLKIVVDNIVNDLDGTETPEEVEKLFVDLPVYARMNWATLVKEVRSD